MEFHLSTEKGRKIAKIYDDKGKIQNNIYITQNKDEVKSHKYNDMSIISDIIGVNQTKIKTHKEILKKLSEGEDIDLSKYAGLIDLLNSRKTREINVEYPCVVQPIPENIPDQVDNLFVAGPSGSGKSSYITRWLVEYMDIYPENNIYLISRKTEDPVLDIIHAKRIKLDDELLSLIYGEEQADSLEIFKNSAVIFDDIDQISEKKMLEGIKKLRDDLLETGRSKGITVICTSHMISNWKNTRQCLNEASDVTFFPQSGSSQQIKSYLVRHQGFTNEQILKILRLNSRWVTIHRRFPIYILYEHGAYLI